MKKGDGCTLCVTVPKGADVKRVLVSEEGTQKGGLYYLPDTNVGDTISRQAAIEAAIIAVEDWEEGYGDDRDEFITYRLNELPAAQSDSKPGYWVVKEGTTAFWDVCSNCGEKTIHRMPHFKYCPYCGRRMDA